jgi:hypothetical protein
MKNSLTKCRIGCGLDFAAAIMPHALRSGKLRACVFFR